MQIVNGKNTQSRRQCIDSQCQRLPIGVFKGKHPRGFQIQIPYCGDHLATAKQKAAEEFKGITFYEDTRSWLKRVQANELKASQEGRIFFTKEG